jgi:BNR/Asp-box repeat
MELGLVRRFAPLVVAAVWLVGLAAPPPVEAAARSSATHARSPRVFSAGPLMDISPRLGNEAETAVAIQQTDTNHITVLSNIGSGTSGSGLVHMWSTDGGATWQLGYVATGTDGLPHACCDPSLTSDEFGNIFMVYLDDTSFSSNVAISTDGGVTFQLLHTLAAGSDRARGPNRAPGRTANTDQPTITAGHGEVWVSTEFNNVMVASGAPVTGLGQVGAWTPLETPGNTSCSACDYGDVAIGPYGQLMMAYQTPSGGQGPATIYTALDPDGVGPAGFNTAVPTVVTNVGGFDYIPAQSGRSVDAEVGLAWDRSRGHRLYLMWTSENPDESNDMDINVIRSNDAGATWSAPVRVNNDATTHSQFNPKIALDQTTGFLAVTWYDCRNDNGQGGTDDTNGIANDDAEMAIAFSPNGGVSFGRNIPLSRAASNDNDAHNGIDYGDYEGLAYVGGYIYPAWADNSNTVGSNPNGTLHQLDVYTVRIKVG